MNRVKPQSVLPYFLAVFTFVVILFLKPHVIEQLDIVAAWLQPCDRVLGVIALTAISLTVFFIRIYRVWMRTERVTNIKVSLDVFFFSLYIYFRFIDGTYLFWGPDSSYLRYTDVIFLPLISYVVLFVRNISRKSDEEKISCPKCFIDHAVRNEADDICHYRELASGLIGTIKTLDLSKDSYSVGIRGEWGQGKSSFLFFLKSKIIKDGDIIVEFYPRAAKSISYIQEDFFDVFKHVLSEYRPEISRYVSRYAKSVAYVGDGLLGKIAIALNICLNEHGKEREQINKIVDSIGKRIYVLIDDLDRLSGEEILETFKLIERNGAFHNTVFITAYDKEYVNNIIKAFLGGEYVGSYTDKYFDFEYSLPIWSHDELNKYMRKSLERTLVLDDKDMTSLSQMLNQWDKVSELVLSSLTTLRHAKRFLNIFMNGYQAVRSDVVFLDYLLLSLLRYNDLTTYNEVYKMSFLYRGPKMFQDRPPRGIYLSKNYLEILADKKISDQSRTIIERLFPLMDNTAYLTIGSLAYIEYRRLCWADSFHNYFYDYHRGESYYEDLQSIYGRDEDMAYRLIDDMYEKHVGYKVEDYLEGAVKQWISDKHELIRFIKVSMYVDKKNRMFDPVVDRLIRGPFFNEMRDRQVIDSKESFIKTIYETLIIMCDICPLSVGFLCQRACLSIYNGESEDNIVLSVPVLIELAILAQEKYYLLYPDGDYIFDAILNLPKIKFRLSDDPQIVLPASVNFVELMKLYPMQFAGDLVLYSTYDDSETHEKHLALRFNSRFDESIVISVEGFSFDAWIESFEEEKIKYVLRKIYKAGPGSTVDVSALKDKYEKGDFDGFYDAIKSHEEIMDDQTVMRILDGNRSMDYSTLSELADIADFDRLKKSVNRLIENKIIDENYSNMKDIMEPFEVYDYVRLVNDEDAIRYGYTNNVFIILDILEDSYRLGNISDMIPRNQVEAIPIDGAHDKCVMYDIPAMATYVSEGMMPPAFGKGEVYYMDFLDEELRSNPHLRKMFSEANCRFLHEVMHFMRKHFPNGRFTIEIME